MNIRIFFNTVIIVTVGTLLASTDLPTDGIVVGGSAEIASTPQRVTVTQTTNRAIVNWRDFNISQGKEFRSIQPGGGSVLFNRVVGGNPSHIAGKLTAVTPRGEFAGTNIVVSNGAGITVGGGAVFDANGVLITTRDVRNAEFMAGANNFSGNGDAPISIAGDVKIARRGSWIAFAGSKVAHKEGQLLAAPCSKIVLAGAEAYSISLDGPNGLVEFVPDPSKASGMLAVQLNRRASINADNGHVLLQTQDVVSAIRSTVSVDGVIEATKATKGKGGVIRLLGGEGSAVKVSGTLSVRAPPESKSLGGTIHVTGDKVNILDTAELQASGCNAGGSIHIGGIIDAGKPVGVCTTEFSLREAKDVHVGSARLNADATEMGDGGVIDIWALDHLAFGAVASARGGPLGGNGGYIDTSSPNPMNRLGSFTVNTKAPMGKWGMYRIDPASIEIVLALPVPLTTGVQYVTVSSLLSDLESSNVTLDTAVATADLGGGSAPYSITLSTALTIPSSINSELTLAATGGVNIWGEITHEGSALLQVVAGGDINITHAISNSGSGDVDIFATGDVSISNALENFGSGVVNVAAFNPANPQSSDLTMSGLDSRVYLEGDGKIILAAGRDVDLSSLGSLAGGNAAKIQVRDGPGIIELVAGIVSVGSVLFPTNGNIQKFSHTGAVYAYYSATGGWDSAPTAMSGVDVIYRWITSASDWADMVSAWTTGTQARTLSFALRNDITLDSNTQDLSVSHSTDAFTGYFSGEGNTITIDRSALASRTFRALFPMAINTAWDSNTGGEIPTIRYLNIDYGTCEVHTSLAGGVAGTFNGYMKNVEIFSATIDPKTFNYMGGLVGKVVNKAWFIENTVENVHIQDSTGIGSNRGSHIGALVGGAVNDAGTPLELKFQGNTVSGVIIESKDYLAGLIGSIVAGDGAGGSAGDGIEFLATDNSITTLTINGSDGIAGLVGYVKAGNGDSAGNGGNITFTASNNTLGVTNLSGNDLLGGLVGYVTGGAGGDTTGTAGNGGNVTFYANNNTLTTTTVTGNDSLGGLIGLVRGGEGGTDTNATNHGAGGDLTLETHDNTLTTTYTTGQDYLGGIVGGARAGGADVGGTEGNMTASIKRNAFTTSALKGRSYIGGIAGLLNGETMDLNLLVQTNAITTGYIEASGFYAGGLVGFANITTGTVPTPSAIADNTVSVHMIASDDFSGGLFGRMNSSPGITFNVSNNQNTGTLMFDTSKVVGGVAGYVTSLSPFTGTNSWKSGGELQNKTFGAITFDQTLLGASYAEPDRFVGQIDNTPILPTYDDDANIATGNNSTTIWSLTGGGILQYTSVIVSRSTSVLEFDFDHNEEILGNVTPNDDGLDVGQSDDVFTPNDGGSGEEEETQNNQKKAQEKATQSAA